jgi:hypothetical protein
MLVDLFLGNPLDWVGAGATRAFVLMRAGPNFCAPGVLPKPRLRLRLRKALLVSLRAEAPPASGSVAMGSPEEDAEAPLTPAMDAMSLECGSSTEGDDLASEQPDAGGRDREAGEHLWWQCGRSIKGIAVAGG